MHACLLCLARVEAWCSPATMHVTTCIEGTLHMIVISLNKRDVVRTCRKSTSYRH